jgi:putative PIG3 family NAD(P)H quinone oxidoreductase
MRAVLFDAPGDESVLRVGEAPPPVLAPGDVRLRVCATAVNRADLLQRRGLYPPPPGASPILGLECAGEVVAVGPAVKGVGRGERRMALLAGGGYAEEVAVDARHTLPVPADFSDEEAGGFMETFLTAYLNLFVLGEAHAGATVLVHGGASGVGTAAMALCRALGVRILVTASGPKLERCLKLGAALAIDYRAGELAPKVLAATGGVDVVLDPIGAPYLAQDLDCLAPGGRLVLIGLSGGSRGEVDLAPLLRKRLRVIGSTLRNRSADEKAGLVASFAAALGEALTAGRVRPVIDRVLPLAEVAEAHRLVQASAHVGKVVLRVS